MAKSRTRKVARSAKTGRFIKKSTARRHPSTTIVETVGVKGHSVKMARSASTGRFVKPSTAKRHPNRTIIDTIKR